MGKHTQVCFKSDAGFTLIELMVVIGIIGILSLLGMTSFNVYKKQGAYAVVESLVRDSKTVVEGSLNNVDNPPSAVALVSQSSPGSITDSAAYTLLPELKLPRDVSLSVSYDPSCDVSTCQQQFVQVKHCKGDEYIQWIRFGDGVDVTLDRIAGAGCGP